MQGMYEVFESPLGKVFVAEIGSQVCALSFDTSTPATVGMLMKTYPEVEFVKGHTTNKTNILRLLNGVEISEKIPISPCVFAHCSDFHREVYNQLMRIPRGSTKSYAEIAKAVGRPTAYRAVAQACKNNVLALVIPCHRVVGSDGSLTGYSGGGVAMKQRLLELERVKH